jgi:hypothetical protein
VAGKSRNVFFGYKNIFSTYLSLKTHKKHLYELKNLIYQPKTKPKTVKKHTIKMVKKHIFFQAIWKPKNILMTFISSRQIL